MATADRAPAHGRPLRWRRRSDRHDTLICHGLRSPAPIALPTTAMGLPARFALLVATVSVMSLPSSHFQTALWTTVALATVATSTDCEHAPGSRVTANPEAKNTVLVDVHIGHKGIMASWKGLSEVVGIRPRPILAISGCVWPALSEYRTISGKRRTQRRLGGHRAFTLCRFILGK